MSKMKSTIALACAAFALSGCLETTPRNSGSDNGGRGDGTILHSAYDQQQQRPAQQQAQPRQQNKAAPNRQQLTKPATKRPAPQLLRDDELQALIGQPVPRHIGDGKLMAEEGGQIYPGIRMFWWGAEYWLKPDDLRVVPRAFATVDRRGGIIAIHQLTAEQQKRSGEVIECNLHGTSGDRRYWIGINPINGGDAFAVYAVDRNTGRWKAAPKPLSRYNCSEM